jgi:hypothetical protein
MKASPLDWITLKTEYQGWKTKWMYQSMQVKVKKKC